MAHARPRRGARRQTVHGTPALEVWSGAELLDQARAAIENGRAAEAVTICESLLEREPRSVPALRCLGVALAELRRVGDAERTFLRALRVAPADVEILLAAINLLVCTRGDDRQSVERGLALCARGQKIVRKSRDRTARFKLLLLEGIGLNQLGESERAENVLSKALGLHPSSVDARLERAIARFELCQFTQAERDLRELVRSVPDDAWAQHYLGLIVERRDDRLRGNRHLARARSLAPVEFPPPVHLEERDFDRCVHEALRRLPDAIREALERVSIRVERLPAEEELRSSWPPLSPSILGIFQDADDEQRAAVPSIVLYERNLERFARTRAELVEQIAITLLHEAGHLIGLDEEALWSRGLE